MQCNAKQGKTIQCKAMQCHADQSQGKPSQAMQSTAEHCKQSIAKQNNIQESKAKKINAKQGTPKQPQVYLSKRKLSLGLRRLHCLYNLDPFRGSKMFKGTEEQQPQSQTTAVQREAPGREKKPPVNPYLNFPSLAQSMVLGCFYGDCITGRDPSIWIPSDFL